MQIFKMGVITPPRCPTCDSSGIVEEDVVFAYAGINGVHGDGTIEWSGESEVDWNTQRPAHDPPHYNCEACGTRLKLVGTEFELEAE